MVITSTPCIYYTFIFKILSDKAPYNALSSMSGIFVMINMAFVVILAIGIGKLKCNFARC